MSALSDEYIKNFSKERKSIFNKRFRDDYDPNMSERSNIIRILNEMRELNLADGGRIGLKEGLGYFTTNDPEEAMKEVVKRFIEKNIQTTTVPISENIFLNLAPGVSDVELGGIMKILGGELNLGASKDKGIGFNFKKEFNKGGRIGFFKGAQADTAKGKAMSPGTTASGGFRGGGGDGPKGPPSVINPPPKTNPIVEKLKKRNPPSDSIFKRFVDHDRFTDFMKILQTPNYHQMGGLDFMARFPNINPNVAKGLATAYQQITEMAKANPNPLDDYTNVMENAQKKAIEEARLNAIGIDDFFDPTSDTYKQYTDTSFGVKDVAVPLADGGIARMLGE